MASVVGTVIHYLVGTWAAVDSSSTKKKAGIINNESFKLVGSADGGTGGSGHPPIASPNGKYRVFRGGLWFDLDGVAESYGGDKGDKSVTRTGITDDDMAIGSASEQVDSEPLLVITGLGSQPDTAPTVEDSDPPIDIVEIDLRLVWISVPEPSV